MIEIYFSELMLYTGIIYLMAVGFGFGWGYIYKLREKKK